MRIFFLLCFIIPFLWISIENPAAIKYRLAQAAYHSTHYGKKLGRDLEFATRPSSSFRQKTSFLSSLPMHCALGAIGLVCRTIFATANYFIPGPIFKIVEVESLLESAPLTTAMPLKILSLNACFRAGFFAPFTGGVVHPFEAVTGHSSRVEAIATWVGKQAPDIFVGQEFMDLNSTYVFIETMKSFGYTSFIYDPTLSPLGINSGLFVASKRPIGNISFVTYPDVDKKGIEKFARRGALRFDVLDSQKQPILCIYNTHLDAGEDQSYRTRQLKHHLLPRFSQEKKPAIIVGDLNFDTSLYGKEAGLEGYTNILEGHVTCSDEGKLALRGITAPANLYKIDAIIANTAQLHFNNTKAEQVKAAHDILSDHFGISTLVYLQKEPQLERQQQPVR